MSLEEAVLLAVFEKGEASASEIAQKLNIPVERAREALERLSNAGYLIVSEGKPCAG